MATPKINQKEYLKKYLSNDDKKKKKKKKKHIGQKTVKIIDDDVDLGKIRAIEEDAFDIVDTNEDAPQIVGIVDERGEANFSKTSGWRIIADDGTGELIVQERKLNKRDEDGHEDVQNQGTFKSLITIKEERDSEDESHRKRNEKSENRNKRNRKRDDDDDISPPRQRKSKSSKRKDSSDSDSRKKKSPERSSRNRNNDSDLSPPRKSGDKRSRARNKNSDSDMSPPRKSGRKDSDSDLSPPRKSGRKDSDSDLSPPRKSGRKDNDSDLSPPRSTIKKEKHSNLSPPRRDTSKNERASSSRRKKKDDLDQDLSPRIRRRSRERSPRRSKDNGRYSRSDGRYEKSRAENRRDSERNSPSKRNRNRSESPPRRLRKSRWNRESRSRSREASKDRRMKKTLDGKTAGLQNANALREETDAYKKRENEMFKELIKVSGPNQSVVKRDKKSLRRRDLEAEAAIEREKKEREQEMVEKYEKWGGGLRQLDDREEKLKNDLHEMTKPLARYIDDEDLQAMQKQKLREDDPMLQFASDKLIEKGLIIKKEHSASGHQLMDAPNRFGISPGSRWDGVDRSNGYEKKWFEAENRKKAVSEEAYKWSTSDM